MGLGPSVCEKCQVLAVYSEKGVHDPDCWHSSKLSHWYCPICGNPNPKASAGFDPDNFKRLEKNEKFLRFMTGKLDDKEHS